MARPGDPADPNATSRLRQIQKRAAALLPEIDAAPSEAEKAAALERTLVSLYTVGFLDGAAELRNVLAEEAIVVQRPRTSGDC